MTVSMVMPDKARDIATAYWRSTPHCFQADYPEKDLCQRCRWHLADVRHASETPKPVNTITEVTAIASIVHSNQPPLNFIVTPSCGHEAVRRGRPDGRHKAPQVGDPFDCWTCETAWQDANFPGLPTEVYAEINTLIPRCPECDEPMKYLPFITYTKHDVSFEIDGAIGQLDGQSEVYDTLDELPEWERHLLYTPGDVSDLADGWQTGEIAVSCENNHEWKTRRLAWRHENSAHNWRIIDAG